MGNYLRGLKKKFSGKVFGSWTREGSKSGAIAEQKTQHNKGNLARIVKASGVAGRHGFWDVYIRKGKKKRKR